MALAECMLTASNIIGHNDVKLRFSRAILSLTPIQNINENIVKEIFLSNIDINDLFDQIL